jgi:hypothetical protein
MDHPDADHRETLERLEAYFLNITRKGLALRSGDIDVLKDWQKRGVPEDVVRRGVAEGVRRFLATAEPAAPLPAVLRYYRTFVETEFATYRRAVEQGRIVAVAASPHPATGTPAANLSGGLGAVAKAWLLDERDRAADDATRAVWAGAIERLSSVPASRSMVDALEALDEEVLTGLLAAAAPEVRARVDQRVRDTVEDARRRGAGVDARTDLEAAERRAAATEECGYRNLLEAALERARKGPVGRTA